ncbi:hypothetical protein MRX96_013663 [Rhipicephalus microplus]
MRGSRHFLEEPHSDPNKHGGESAVGDDPSCGDRKRAAAAASESFFRARPCSTSASQWPRLAGLLLSSSVRARRPSSPARSPTRRGRPLAAA